VLESEINTIFDRGIFNIEFDLKELQFISNAGAGVFIGAAGTVSDNNGEIKIINPSDNIREVFDLLGLSTGGFMFSDYDKLFRGIIRENQISLFDLEGNELKLAHQRHVRDCLYFTQISIQIIFSLLWFAGAKSCSITVTKQDRNKTIAILCNPQVYITILIKISSCNPVTT